MRDERLGAALRELEVPAHRPAFEALLARRLAEEHRRRRRARARWGLRLAAVAVVAAVAAVGIPRVADEPEVATAAEVQAQVREALAEMRTLTGVLVDGGARWRFALTADGDLWLAGPGPDEWIAYDAQAAVVRSAQRSASLGGGPVFYAERRGVAPGPPDERAPLPREYGAFVRALLAADDPRVRETDDSWHVEVELVPDEFSGDRLELTVDRATGMPVRVAELKDGAELRTLRFEALRVDAELPPGTFRPAFPDGAEVMRSDDGFRRGALGEAPLAPRWVPAGYELAEVGVNPERGIVSLSYRRGLDQFLVSTRPGGGGPGLVLEPGELPQLRVRRGALLVTVVGDLSRAELLRVAESLAPR